MSVYDDVLTLKLARLLYRLFTVFRVLFWYVVFYPYMTFGAPVSAYFHWDDLRCIFWMKTPERPLSGPKTGNSSLDELAEVKIEGSDIRVPIAEVALAVVIGRCKETTGIGSLTFQAFIGKSTDAMIVQHVAESAIVVSIAGQGSGDEQAVGHDVLHECVKVVLA